MGEFRMPSLGADMESGTIVAWHVAPGDHVKRGDIVATVDTSKAEIDVEIFQDGTIDELLVPAGERVPVGTVLATVRSEPAAAPAIARAQPAAPVEPAVAQVQPPTRQPATAPAPRAPQPVTDGARRRASPLARRTATELGIALDQISGSGPHGAILAADVLGRTSAAAPPAAPPAAPHPHAAPPAGEPDRAKAMRQAIATAMARSKREIPHYYLRTDIDLTTTLEWLADHNATLPVAERVLTVVPLLKAVALALHDFPALNGYWVDGALQPGPGIHLGVAISLRTGGLIAPAIHDADTLSIDALMRALRDLVRRTRSGGLRSSELTDATLTVTNLADGGATSVYGVIYPPQVALVGFGTVTERPWASGGMLGVRRAVTATLAADHRASDGHLGAGLLNTIDHLLQTPEEL